MAPNRKAVACLHESLSCSDLQYVIEAKFLPLTDSRESEQERCTTTKELLKTPGTETPTSSYWDWPAEKDIQEKVDVLSTSNIVSNLIQAAAKYNESDTSCQILAAHDDYWAEHAEGTGSTQDALKKPQHHDVYWSWPSEQYQKKEIIKHILSEEAARKPVADSIVDITARQDANELFHLKSSNDEYWNWEFFRTKSHALDPANRNMHYWDWNEETTSPIDEILEYENAREIVSVSNIEKNLLTNSLKPSGNTCALSDSYWTWSELLGDKYWEAPQQQAVTTGYWDW